MLMPVPAYRLRCSVPLSKNDAPLDVTPSAPITVLRRFARRPLDAILRDAQKFALPAPAPIRPPSVMYVAPFCSASFTCAGDRPALACSSSATEPVTIGA